MYDTPKEDNQTDHFFTKCRSTCGVSAIYVWINQSLDIRFIRIVYIKRRHDINWWVTMNFMPACMVYPMDNVVHRNE